MQRLCDFQYAHELQMVVVQEFLYSGNIQKSAVQMEVLH
jgi:hypothetical protein